VGIAVFYKHPLTAVAALWFGAAFSFAGETPAAEISAALLDAQRLAPEQARNTRYLSLYAIDKDGRDAVREVIDYWVNAISREPNIVVPRRVTDTLLAVELSRYGWPEDVWEKFLPVEAYFHQRVKVPAKTKSPKVYWRGGGGYPARWYEHESPKDEEYTVLAPWVNRLEGELLSVRTNSAVPIVRADWFLFQTGDEVDRVVGYYQWLGISSAKDAERLAGFDKGLAQARKREVAAIVIKSGVTRKARQIFRFGAVDGCWWETRDADKASGDGNALRQLDDHYKFKAMEIFFALPNGLFGFLLLNDRDAVQKEAPNKIANDRDVPNNDTAVRISVSCNRCHEGLKPFSDSARFLYRADGPVLLSSPDEKVKLRLEQLYLGEIQESYDADQDRYARALKRTSPKLTPARLRTLWRGEWERYESSPIDATVAARELGLDRDRMVESLRAALLANKTIDPVAALLMEGKFIDREQFEEIVSLLMNTVVPVVPKGK
jgi:hypothetical protein